MVLVCCYVMPVCSRVCDVSVFEGVYMGKRVGRRVDDSCVNTTYAAAGRSAVVMHQYTVRDATNGITPSPITQLISLDSCSLRPVDMTHQHIRRLIKHHTSRIGFPLTYKLIPRLLMSDQQPSVHPCRFARSN